MRAKHKSEQLRLPTIPAVRAATPPTWGDIARQLPCNVLLGTSSWSFPGWRGLVYDGTYTAAELAHEGLAAYAQNPLLRTVGVDRTHYAPVAEAQYRIWGAAVPEDFRFLVKAHEACTVHIYPRHARYGGRAGKLNDLFLSAPYARDNVVGPLAAGLGARVGVVLFQFVAQNLVALGGPECFAARLHAFLRDLASPVPVAVELRNAELLTPAYAAALAATGAVHCFNALDGMPDLPEQSRRLGPMPPCLTVVRWMRHQGIGYEAAVARYRPFAQLMDPDVATREHIAQLCRQAAAALVIVNNKAEGCAPLSVAQLARLLGAS